MSGIMLCCSLTFGGAVQRRAELDNGALVVVTGAVRWLFICRQ